MDRSESTQNQSGGPIATILQQCHWKISGQGLLWFCRVSKETCAPSKDLILNGANAIFNKYLIFYCAMKEKNRQVTKAVMANILGNSLDTYDFALYGTLAPIISKQFFPAHNPEYAIILTYIVFSLAFITRPIGGTIFGLIGDRYGRRMSLLISVAVIVIPSTLLAITPGYQVLGIWSTLFLIFTRLLQGLSNGGEYTATMVYLSEMAGYEKYTYSSYCALTSLGGLLGVLLGIVITIITQHFLGIVAFNEWGWRLPYLFSIVIAAFAFIMRRYMAESPVFLAEPTEQSPKSIDFYSYIPNYLQAMGVTFNSGTFFWMAFTYVVTFYSRVDSYQKLSIYAVDCLGVVCGILGVLTIAYISQFMRNKWIIVANLLILIVFAFVWNDLVLMHLQLQRVAAVQAFLCFFAGIYIGAAPGIVCSLFPSSYRCTMSSITYNLAIVFSGFIPSVATLLLVKGNMYSPAIMMTVGCVVALVALLTLSPQPDRLPE